MGRNVSTQEGTHRCALQDMVISGRACIGDYSCMSLHRLLKRSAWFQVTVRSFSTRSERSALNQASRKMRFPRCTSALLALRHVPKARNRGNDFVGCGLCCGSCALSSCAQDSVHTPHTPHMARFFSYFLSPSALF
mmetsp:Transcript_3344/g.10255  ORF Transcript_3344/g.10255 Transcript_3344/m.10255 type:complete len:136 (-) Transcript_3344:100-507(-)|eukprot:scaffold130224_cov32-Tisochrysis_lutea.AAC.1